MSVFFCVHLALGPTRWAGPEPIVINGAPISGRKYMGDWGEITPMNGVISPHFMTSRGPPLW